MCWLVREESKEFGKGTEGLGSFVKLLLKTLVAGCGIVLLVPSQSIPGALPSTNSASASVQGASLLGWSTQVLLFTTIAWEPSPSPDVTGYALYLVMPDLHFTNRLDVGAVLTITVPFQLGTSNLIYAVAYNRDQVESEPSNALNYVPPPITQPKVSISADGMAQIRSRTSPHVWCRVEWTADLTTPVWQTLTIVQADGLGDVVALDPDAAETPARFYRVIKE